MLICHPYCRISDPVRQLGFRSFPVSCTTRCTSPRKVAGLATNAHVQLRRTMFGTVMRGEKGGISDPWLRLLVKGCENNRSSRSADQLFLVLFTEQGRRYPMKKGFQLRFLFGRPAIKQFRQAIMAGARYCSDGLLPGSSQLELAMCLTSHRCCRGD